jgi:hypothetical protein
MPCGEANATLNNTSTEDSSNITVAKNDTVGNVVEQNENFDIVNFFATFSKLFSMGTDFSENGNNYKWAMKEF